LWSTLRFPVAVLLAQAVEIRVWCFAQAAIPITV
jgi:hypothetical protein